MSFSSILQTKMLLSPSSGQLRFCVDGITSSNIKLVIVLLSKPQVLQENVIPSLKGQFLQQPYCPSSSAPPMLIAKVELLQLQQGNQVGQNTSGERKPPEKSQGLHSMTSITRSSEAVKPKGCPTLCSLTVKVYVPAFSVGISPFKLSSKNFSAV